MDYVNQAEESDLIPEPYFLATMDPWPWLVDNSYCRFKNLRSIFTWENVGQKYISHTDFVNLVQ